MKNYNEITEYNYTKIFMFHIPNTILGRNVNDQNRMLRFFSRN